jgi:hypothetical protein
LMNILVPTLIFFTSTMLYPRSKGISNMQHGVCMYREFFFLN